MKIIVIFAICALVGMVIVMQPAWLCGALGIGCKGGFARDCLRARGATTEFTPGLSPSGESFSAHLGGKEVISGAENSEELELILNCVEKAYARNDNQAESHQKDDYVTKAAIQLGLVEEQWRDGDVTLEIVEPTDQNARDHLMNLAFGPAGGKRTEIMKQWCVANEACVSCETAENSYLVSAKGVENFKKAYNGTGPLASDRKETYQLIEADDSLGEGVGRRVIFLCSASQ